MAPPSIDPLIPAKAGTQMDRQLSLKRRLGPRLRGDERLKTVVIL